MIKISVSVCKFRRQIGSEKTMRFDSMTTFYKKRLKFFLSKLVFSNFEEKLDKNKTVLAMWLMLEIKYMLKKSNLKRLLCLGMCLV